MPQPLVLGAVAYDPKVVTIWEGFGRYLGERGQPLDYVLYSNYERQVDALLDGHIDVAWNSPLAWVRAQRVARARGVEVSALCMRDTDRDNRSVIVVRADASIDSVEALRGRTVAVGAGDSPQATLLPLHALLRAGLDPARDVTVQRHEVLGGLHGDHVGGERDAAQALVDGAADAACMLEANYAAFIRAGAVPPLATATLLRTAPYDHCNMTAGPAAPAAAVERLRALLLGMDPAEPEVARLFALEGLARWCEARTSGYGLLEDAVEAFGYYTAGGAYAGLQLAAPPHDAAARSGAVAKSRRPSAKRTVAR